MVRRRAGRLIWRAATTAMSVVATPSSFASGLAGTGAAAAPACCCKNRGSRRNQSNHDGAGSDPAFG
jgi:hypothetical protein